MGSTLKQIYIYKYVYICSAVNQAISPIDILVHFFLFAPPFFNPLMADPLYLVCMAKISILKKEGIIKKISYEHRAY